MKNNLNQILKEIIKDTEIPNIPISGISTNSVNISPGELYIAIKGSNFDGHDFISEAIQNGAAAVVAHKDYIEKLPIPLIKVKNTRKKVSQIAAEFYNHPTKRMNVVGITGTNGKTTTASLLTSILQSAGNKTAQIGTLGFIAEGNSSEKGLTTPDSITLHQSLNNLCDDGFTHIVMEASSHALDQYRIHDIDFNFTVFTNSEINSFFSTGFLYSPCSVCSNFLIISQNNCIFDTSLRGLPSKIPIFSSSLSSKLIECFSFNTYRIVSQYCSYVELPSFSP